MGDKVFLEKAALVFVILALIAGTIAGDLVGYERGFADGHVEGSESNDIPIIYVPCIEPPKPTGYIFITSNTPCSEPYRININAINPEYDVGDWVKSNKDYEKIMRKSFQGQIIEISDTGVATVCINNDTYKHMDKFWLMHWDCEMIIHDPDIGYYCYTKLIDGTYCFNENSTMVSVIYG